MSKKITIPYKPRARQQEAHADINRWSVFVCHRRAGKTVFALMELQGKKQGRGALNIKDGRFAYIAPTYKQAKNIARDLVKKFSNMIPGIKYNESELTVTYPNGAKIRLYGADNPDSLRGISLDGCVFDEYSQQPSNIFGEIIRPALADRKGWALWIGTPKGQNAFYELYNFSKGKDRRYSKLLKASESGILDQEELEDARSLMTKEEYEQEFECSFNAAVRGAYYSKDLAECRNSKRIINGLYDKALPVYTFRDLGISDYTSIIFVQLLNREVRIIDCYTHHGEGIDHYANVCREKVYNYAKHYFPHDVQHRELTTGMSRLETFAKIFGADKCEVTKNLPIADGINAARMMFANTWFDTDNTQDLRNALANYRQEWNEKKGEFKDKPLHDWSSHYADAFRYLGVTYNTLTTPEPQDDNEYVLDLSDLYGL